MTDKIDNEGGYSLDRRTALKIAGAGGVGMFGTVSFSGMVAADGHEADLEDEDGYDICGTKKLTEDLEDHLYEIGEEYPLAGWEINLYDVESDAWDNFAPIATVETNEDGEYCFFNVPEGRNRYFLCETPKPGTVIVYPQPDGCYREGESFPDGTAGHLENDITKHFKNDLAPDQGCTPGFWCNPAQNKGWWGPENDVGGYYTDDLIGVVFDDDGLDPGWLEVGGRGPHGGDDLAERTLGDAVCNLSGGPDLADAQSQLAGHATAALLNAAHEYIDYPMTEDEVINAVQDALNTEDRSEVLAQKDVFDEYNNLGCTIDAFGEPED